MKKSKIRAILGVIFAMLALLLLACLVAYANKLDEFKNLMILKTEAGDDSLSANLADLGIPHSITEFSTDNGDMYWAVRSRPELMALLYDTYKDDPKIAAWDVFANAQGTLFVFYCAVFMLPAAICALLFCRFRDKIIRAALFLVGYAGMMAGIYVFHRYPVLPPSMARVSRPIPPLFEYVASQQSPYVVLAACSVVLALAALALLCFAYRSNSQTLR
ncbi:MAG: hypothetical protein FWH48_07395 [Oscillospiraceae bacterium]|nr:hypothetical protein [Oscillospiraceae bacterium]